MTSHLLSAFPSRLVQSLPSRLSSDSSLYSATGTPSFKRPRQTLEYDQDSFKRTKWESSAEVSDEDSSSDEEQAAAFDLEGYLRFRKTLEEAATGETAEVCSSVCSETGQQM